MWILWTLVSAALFFTVLVLAVSFICFRMAFYVRREKQAEEDAKLPIPEGEEYEPYREQIINWINEIRSMPRRAVEISSHDGLRLAGYFYEYEKGAPIEILFHGYRGNAERDLSGGVARCFSLGRSALIVDQRAAGRSEGNVISFGINESLDCVEWVNYVVNNIDKDAKIIITGISMGAATVLMASAMELPENVVGVLADCGYTSSREIIKKVMRDMHLPANLFYPFVRLGAIIFGKFDPDSNSPIEAMKKTRLPVIFFHGDTDDFVPHSMSVENFEACGGEKRMVTIKGAGHGLAFPVDMEKYLFEAGDFFKDILK
ncbi:MAG: alpha/beta hydrolase [Clostridia bacterium]|nr:alpha/beta hydrolase [Clostridia bacterium]